MPSDSLPPGHPIARPWLVAASLWLALATLAVWHLQHDAIGNQGRELRLLSLAGGGVIDVHLGRLQVLQPQVLSHTRLLPGHCLTLSVTDQGAASRPR